MRNKLSAPKGNNYALGNKGGRPAKYKKPADLDKKINQYFESCYEKIRSGKTINKILRRPLSITGLCLYLGFSGKDSFYDYEKRQEFSNCIKRARLAIENFYEERLSSTTPTGSIFALKNFGWRDTHEHEVMGKDGGEVILKVVYETKKFNPDET